MQKRLYSFFSCALAASFILANSPRGFAQDQKLKLQGIIAGRSGEDLTLLLIFTLDIRLTHDILKLLVRDITMREWSSNRPDSTEWRMGDPVEAERTHTGYATYFQ